MRKFLKKHKNSAGIKLGVFALSLAACLIMLEAGLRLTGYAISSGRRREFVAPYDESGHDADYTFERYRAGKKSARLILTFGDSLTNGNNVKSYHSFPYYLHSRFSDAGSRTAVYNLGKCEESTFGVAAKFKSYLETSAPEQLPDVAVILVGAADVFNIPLMRERMRDDGSVWHDVLPAGWFYTLRIYKVYRHLRLSWALRRAGARPAAEKTAAEKFELLLEVYRRHMKNKAAVVPRELAPDLVEMLAPVFGDEAERYNLDLRRAGDFMELLADYANRVYSTQMRYDSLFSLLLEAAEAFPAEFWTGDFDAANFHFVQSYQVQSRHTAAEVLKVLDRAAGTHPGLLRNEDFRSFRRLLTDREEVERYVERQRLEAWDEIVRLSREKNVKLVLQNYPVVYQGANRTLEDIARKYDLPLVDNRAFFAERIREKGRGEFLEDNDHLTPMGNRLMAQNVYDTLIGKKILLP